MRRTEGFDYCITRRRPAGGLQTFLQHRFVVGFRCCQRIGAFQLIAERITNKPGSGFETTVQEDRSGGGFEYICQQGILLSATALFFAPSESKKLAKVQFERSLSKCRRAHESMLHARQFTFSAGWVRTTQIVRHY